MYINPNITSSSASEIATKVRDVVQNYANNDIKNFDSVFRYSQFVNRIDLADKVSFLTLQQLDAKDTFDAILNQESKYTLNFYNPIFTQGAGSTYKLIFNWF